MTNDEQLHQRAKAYADAAAARLRKQVDAGRITSESLGWPGVTNEQIIEAEWQDCYAIARYVDPLVVGNEREDNMTNDNDDNPTLERAIASSMQERQHAAIAPAGLLFEASGHDVGIALAALLNTAKAYRQHRWRPSSSARKTPSPSLIWTPALPSARWSVTSASNTSTGWCEN